MTREEDGSQKEAKGLRTLQRGLAVMELLGRADGGYPLSEIAQRLNLAIGTTHRLRRTLIEEGYVEHDPRTRWYQLGLKVLELRGATVGAIRMAAEARPFLPDLMLRTGQRAHLAVYRGGAVVNIDRVDTPDTVGRCVPIGIQKPAHATGPGKVILAHAPAEEVEAYLTRRGLAGYTESTGTDTDAFRHELAATRERGYAYDRGEFNTAVRCIAAPIFHDTCWAMAALSVAGTPEEIDPRRDELAALVVAAAQAVSRRFGYRPAEEMPLADMATAGTVPS